MATVNMAYDHPQYTVHQNIAMGEGGGSATTFAKFIAVTACQAYSVQYSVTTAGTQTASGGAQLNFVKVTGTNTTTATFVNVGTATVGNTRNQVLSGSAGGLALAAGDLLMTVQGTEATLRGVVGYEVAFQPLVSVTS